MTEYGYRLKTLIDLEREEGIEHPRIIYQTIYEDGYSYFEIMTDDSELIAKLEEIGFFYWYHINLADIEVPKAEVKKVVDKIKDIPVEIKTFEVKE